MNITSIRYYTRKLHPEWHFIYNHIFSEIESHKRKIDIETPIYMENLKTVVRYVFLDNPSLYYVNANTFNIQQINGKSILHLTYHYNKAEAGYIKRQIIEKINEITRPILENSFNNIEKEKILYDYITQNVKYDNSATADYENHSIVGPLLNNSSVCEGYAKALKYLCDAVGIPCIIISGSRNSPNDKYEPHAWNIVKINKKCYHVDSTWDSIVNSDNSDFYDYFNVSDETIKKDHEWDISLFPNCNEDYNVVQEITGSKMFESYIISQLKDNNEMFQVRFNKQFENESKIMEMVESAINKAPFLLKLKALSIGVRYNKNQNKATIRIG